MERAENQRQSPPTPEGMQRYQWTLLSVLLLETFRERVDKNDTRRLLMHLLCVQDVSSQAAAEEKNQLNELLHCVKVLSCTLLCNEQPFFFRTTKLPVDVKSAPLLSGLHRIIENELGTRKTWRGELNVINVISSL